MASFGCNTSTVAAVHIFGAITRLIEPFTNSFGGSNSGDCGSKNLHADLRRMFVRVESGTHLLVRMDVIAKVTQCVAKLPDIQLQIAKLARCVDQLCQRPIGKRFDLSC